MMERYDVLAGREYTTRDGEVKTAWTRCGSMFKSRKGESFNLVLDAIPAPQEGQFKLACFPPKPRDQEPPRPPGQTGGPLDDEIPF